ncbi:hypothetical protein J2Y48_000437 [Mycoplana sp. BE70]|nr:hypothetical protein [Mycoplana sp. BE70]
MPPSSTEADIRRTSPARLPSFRRYQNAKVPDGYDTAYAFFSRNHPHAFDLLPDPVVNIAADLPTLLKMTQDAGLSAIEVEAPTALRRARVNWTTAFPRTILRRFYR